MRQSWYDQLPMIAALCYSAQDEPNIEEAVSEAVEIIDACGEIDPAVVRGKFKPVKEREG